jgi:hypothetical protein
MRFLHDLDEAKDPTRTPPPNCPRSTLDLLCLQDEEKLNDNIVVPALRTLFADLPHTTTYTSVSHNASENIDKQLILAIRAQSTRALFPFFSNDLFLQWPLGRYLC